MSKRLRADHEVYEVFDFERGSCNIASADVSRMGKN